MKLSKAMMILAAALLVLPAVADGHEDEGSSWFLGFDVMGARPSNVQTGWVLEDPDTDSDPEGNIRALDPSYDFSGRIWFGRSYGADKGGWYVSYTGMQAEENDSASSGSGSLWDILYNADNADDDFSGSAEARMETEAMLIDLAYYRPLHESDKVWAGWSVGLRYGVLDHDLDVDYSGTGEVVMNESETDGIGARVGMNAAVRLSENVWLGAGGGLSYLTGTQESSSFQSDGGSPDVDVSREVDGTFSILDAFVGLRWNVGEKTWLRFAYEFSQWNNALSTPTFPDDVSEGFLTDQGGDVSWDALVIGVGFNFGGGDKS